MVDETVSGPIDFLLLEFAADADTRPAAAAMQDLVDRDLVRVYDVLVVRKELDGSCSAVEFSQVTAAGEGGFRALSGARSGLLGDEDVREAAEAMEPGSVGALIVYENTWARGFVRAASDAGAEVVAGGRIPAQDVMAALDALESAS
ncbi:MAG TPA: DUF6325 family protein [Dermatophilaceae bacterium]|nr:DUF6325 family protein [Dermatophilaceae bacterium]